MSILSPEQRTLTVGPVDRRYWIRPLGLGLVQFGYTFSYADMLDDAAEHFSPLKRTVASVDHCYNVYAGSLLGRLRDRLRPDPVTVRVGAHEVWPVSRELVEYAWSIGCDDRTFTDDAGAEVVEALTAFRQWRARLRLTERRPLVEFVTEVEGVIYERWHEWIGTELASLGEGEGDLWRDEDYFGFNRINDRRLLLRIGTPTLARVLAATLQADGFRAEARGQSIDVFDRSEIYA